jgi:hypothetical protein
MRDNKMKVKVNIIAQVWENKAWYEGREVMRPKGDTVFQIEDVDYDDISCATKEQLTKLFQTLLDEQSDNIYTYEYLDYEVQVNEPQVLAGVDFSDSLNKMFNLGV